MAQRAAPPPVRPPAFTSRTRIMVLLIAGGVIAAVVVSVVLLSGANFTATKASSGNVVAAGTADITVTSPNDPIPDPDQIKPTSARPGDATGSSSGARATVSLAVTGTSAEPAVAAVLTLKIAKK